MTTTASQITSLMVVYSTVYSQIKENIKAPRHWPLCGEFTGTGEFPAQRASNAENVFIWWRHHADVFLCPIERAWQEQRSLRVAHLPTPLESHCLSNSSPPEQNGCHFADDVFKCIFLNEKFCILFRISPKFVPEGAIDNKPALVQVMVRRRASNKPLPETRLT